MATQAWWNRIWRRIRAIAHKVAYKISCWLPVLLAGGVVTGTRPCDDDDEPR
jgi:hypothetical protein